MVFSFLQTNNNIMGIGGGTVEDEIRVALLMRDRFVSDLGIDGSRPGAKEIGLGQFDPACLTDLFQQAYEAAGKVFDPAILDSVEETIAALNGVFGDAIANGVFDIWDIKNAETVYQHREDPRQRRDIARRIASLYMGAHSMVRLLGATQTELDSAHNKAVMANAYTVCERKALQEYGIDEELILKLCGPELESEPNPETEEPLANGDSE